MAQSTHFQSPLAEGIGRFLESKRALGRNYLTEERALRLLDRFLVQEAVTHVEQITQDVLSAFLVSRPRSRPRSFNELTGVVRRLFNWLVTHGVLYASPLRTVRRRETARRVPFLFDTDQARQLLDAAAALRDGPGAPRRGPTYRTVFALLYGLGLRVGEACRLLRDDVDLNRLLLVIRETKFGKSRLVPFGPRIARLIHEHLDRGCPIGESPQPTAPLFTFDGRRCVHPGTVSQTFLHLVRGMDLDVPEGTSPPRLHDLRHSFAVGTLLRWYREGVDPAAKLQHLSTFLGHVDPSSTAIYLTITADLLQEASSRFEAFASPMHGEEEAR